ncbi:MAG: response regulator [Gracilimonas sp.]|uniref:response regulator n=1 Tax=Gracilimonas sp. TaxID=1974203 RepID=UPI0019CB57EF|nr:response regulator [Gracilimonas sp.]MBD3616762.1 response regulator [Gracilimonas sp.]
MNISKKAIIVEDNLILSLLYENYVKEMVFKTVGEISSGEKAVELVQKYAPDIVIMDIMLEGEMDGIQAAEEIRKFSKTPIVFITGNSDMVHLEKAKKIENTKFLRKPISEDKLKKAVDYLLSTRKCEF